MPFFFFYRRRSAGLNGFLDLLDSSRVGARPDSKAGVIMRSGSEFAAGGGKTRTAAGRSARSGRTYLYRVVFGVLVLQDGRVFAKCQGGGAG